MYYALRKKATVQPGGRIEILSDELVPGTIADVIVILKPTSPRKEMRAHMLGVGKGGFTSPKEVDDFMNGERDSWGS